MRSERVTNLKQFSEAKERLVRAYERVLSSELLPVGDLDAVAVREKQQNLLSERFFVAVCGRIKCGKSFLLNALVFGAPVLPTDDTVMTAKNTLLCHGDSPGLIVEFYSKEEWGALVKELRRSEGNWIPFESEIRAAAEQGAIKDECILPSRRIDRVSELGALRLYVTPAEKGGRFSPFVKQVTVEHPHPWLAEVTVADTPGVDDPLKFREDITKNWIHKAGAVLYVSYAGQSLAEPDVRFLDEYLLHVPASRRVIAINKIDLVDGMASVEAYLKSLVASGDARTRSIFGERGGIVFTSALGGLIQRMQVSGQALEGELAEYAEILAGRGYLEAENHGVDKLKAKVEERLIRDKGDGLLVEHASFLDALFERKLRILKQEVSSQTSYRETLVKTEKERSADKARVEQQITRLDGRMDEFDRALRRNLDQHFGRLQDDIKDVCDAAVDAIERRLGKYPDIKRIAGNAAWVVRDAVAAQQGALFKKLSAIQTEVETLFKRHMADLQKVLDDDGASGPMRLGVFLDLPIFDTVRQIRASFRTEASRERFDAVVEEFTTGWQRFWNTSGGQDHARDAVANEARDLLDKELEVGLVHQLRAEVYKATQEAKQEIQEQVNRALQTRRQEIDDIERGLKDREDELNRVDRELQTLSDQRGAAEALRAEVSSIGQGEVPSERE